MPPEVKLVRMEVRQSANPLLAIDDFVPRRINAAQPFCAYLVQENRRDWVSPEDGVDEPLHLRLRP
jgi:hypothetical protein